MKVAVLFPGYGGQFVGMAKEMYDEYRIVQEYFDEASNCLDFNFVKLCFASSEKEISELSSAYTSIFLTSSAFAALLRQRGIIPDVVAGYGLGEFAAFHAAGSITFPDGIYLLKKYISYVQDFLKEKPLHLMRVTGLPADVVQEVCEKCSTKKWQATMSIYEPDQYYLVVDPHVTERVQKKITALRGSIKEVPVAYGLYTSLLEPMSAQLKLYLEKVDFKDVAMPLLNSIDGRLLVFGMEFKKYILQQITAPLRWDTLAGILSTYDLLIEAGPGTELAKKLKIQYPELAVYSVNTPADVELIVKKVEEMRSHVTENTHVDI